MEIKKVFPSVLDFKIGAKVEVVDKDSGEKVVMTHVTFDVDAMPGQFDDIMFALAANKSIDVSFSSPQSKLDIQ